MEWNAPPTHPEGNMPGSSGASLFPSKSPDFRFFRAHTAARGSIRQELRSKVGLINRRGTR